uniref:Uncharacterized protein n=1 Tax=Anguilla anguilla TaxID=7936 RepID=A0A0E9QVX1_ANGAN
MFQKNITSA